MEKKEIFDLKSTNKLLICLFSMKFMSISGSGRILGRRIPDIRPDIRFFVKIRPDPDIRYSPSEDIIQNFLASDLCKAFFSIGT